MLGNFVTDVVVVVVVLSLMIFIHELGHFVAAKWFGVRVLTFSLGFGKRLLGFRRGDTDYRLSALPLGGYVKMAGEDPSQPRAGDPGEFLGRPRWQRFVVAIMGPAMNVVLAIVLLTVLYRYHFQKPAFEEQPARVGDVEPSSPAAQAGVLAGDLIVRVGGISNPKWEDVMPTIATSAGQPLPLEVERDGHLLRLTITPRADGRDEMGYAGWAPETPCVLGTVEPGFPAGKAGLMAGDRIAAIDGNKVAGWGALIRALQLGQGKKADFAVERNRRELHVQVQPIYTDVGGDGEKRWRIGVGPPRREVVVRQLPWEGALVTSLEDNFRSCLVTLDFIGKLLARRMSARSLSGPIGIAQISGEAYKEGMAPLIMTVSFISLQLGIFNLLPIPILDGGVIVLLLIEGLIRRDLSLKVKERVAQVGMAFLLLLVVFVMYNDLIKTFKPY
jgi:regulator of sigma E protease